jgi:hypothetical protein
MNNDVFEQFTMFNPKVITNSILCWENALSYSGDLPKFIEILDQEPDSYSRISKWENQTKTINMNSLKQSTGTDLLDKKTLYIANSLAMSFEMCFERYCESKNIKQNEYFLDLTSITIKKSNDLPLDLEHKDNAKFFIIAYINDNYDGGEIFLLNEGISLKPKQASVIIVPAQELKNYTTKNIVGTRYIASVIVYNSVMEAQSE